MKIEKDILSVGEILYDCYPEYKVLGGAPFNFIYHIWQLTGKGKFVSRIGEDDLGEKIQNRLSGESFDTAFIQKDKKHSTGKVQIKLNEKKVPEFIIEENAAYDFIEYEKVLGNYLQNETGLIYFGTLAQRNEVSRNTIQKIAGSGTKSFYDINLRQNFYSKGIIEKSLELADVVKLNEDELNVVNDLLLKEEFDLVKTSQNIIRIFGIDLLCITLGEEGAVLIKDGKINKYKHSAESIVDTVGAGDAYSAVLCIGYLMDWELKKINKLASEFAAEICTIKGAIPENKEFYKKYLEIIENE